MEWVETTGRTLDEAKDRALDQLGVDEADAEFAVVEEPRVGLFGRMRAEARVRARIRPISPPAKRENRRRRRPAGDGHEPALGADGAPPPPPPPPPGVATGPPRSPQRRRSSSVSNTRENSTVDRPDDDASPPLSEQAEVGRAFLAGLLDAFDIEGSIEIRPRPTTEQDGEIIDLLITGDDLGVLIGPQGGTLNAVQEVTRTVVQRQTGGRHGRLLVDVGGYRAKRAEALARFVREVAEKVRASGTATALEAMHAADRKVVHDVVNTIDGVQTYSEGEEPRRRVVLEPADG